MLTLKEILPSAVFISPFQIENTLKIVQYQPISPIETEKTILVVPRASHHNLITALSAKAYTIVLSMPTTPEERYICDKMLRSQVGTCVYPEDLRATVDRAFSESDRVELQH